MSARPLTAKQAVVKVRTLVRKGAVSDALKICNTALSSAPENESLLAEVDKIRAHPRAKAGSVHVQADLVKVLALHRSGRHEELVPLAQKLAPHYPQYPFVPELLGEALHKLDEYNKSAGAYKVAVLLNPGKIETNKPLGITLCKAMRHKEAEEALSIFLRSFPDDTQALSMRGNALSWMSRHEEALRDFDRATELDPDYIGAHFDRGRALIAYGQKSEAITAMETVLRLKPDHGQAHMSLSGLKKYGGADDPHLMQMETLFDSPDMPASEKAGLGFALAKAHDDLGDVDRAFQCLAEGNRLRREMLSYQDESNAQFFSTIRSTFTEKMAPHMDTLPSGDALGELPHQPVFILGMPRSGTTLTEQILASHSQVFGAGELIALRRILPPILESIAGGSDTPLVEHLKKIRSAYGAVLESFGSATPIITDKMPSNFYWIGFIRLAIPEAKIIHLRRDPVATCWSNYRQYFGADGVGYVYDLQDIARFHRRHNELMSHWREVFPDSIYELDYDRLTEDQEGETRALLAHCGLEFEEGCLDFHKTARSVHTASHTQVREKMYRGSSQEWRRYEQHLGPLLEELAPILEG